MMCFVVCAITSIIGLFVGLKYAEWNQEKD